MFAWTTKVLTQITTLLVDCKELLTEIRDGIEGINRRIDNHERSQR